MIEKSGFGSRVPCRFCNTEFGALKFTPQELAIVCELLRPRAADLRRAAHPRGPPVASFSEVGQVEAVLESLSSRVDGPFVVRLSREPGRRDLSTTHTCSAEPSRFPPSQEESGRDLQVASAPAPDQFERLEEEVRQLKEELTRVPARLPPQ